MKRITFALFALCMLLGVARAQIVNPLRVQQAGTTLALEYQLNFTGAGVSCVDNAGSARTDCTINGASLGSYSFTTVTFNMPANAIFASSAQSATNTTALQINPNVADGATSVVVDINNGTTISTAGASYFRIRNNTAAVLNVTQSASGTKILGSGGATAYVLIDDTNGVFLQFNTNNYVTVSGLAANTINFYAGGNNSIGIDTNGIFSSIAKTYLLGSSTKQFKRLFTAGTASVAGDYSASGGWGASASVGTITGDDTHGRFTVTSAGAGQAANPTVTYTFHDGTWTTVPFCLVHLESTTDTVIDTVQVTQSTNATALTITYNGTPVVAKTYTISFICIGG